MGLRLAFKSAVELVGRLRSLLSVRVSAIWAAFDIRDLLVYGGLFLSGYGAYLIYKPSGFLTWGILSMLLGLGWIVRVPKRKE